MSTSINVSVQFLNNKKSLLVGSYNGLGYDFINLNQIKKPNLRRDMFNYKFKKVFISLNASATLSTLKTIVYNANFPESDIDQAISCANALMDSFIKRLKEDINDELTNA